MRIKDHAIRRFKKRIPGHRSSSRARISRKIHKEIENRTIRRHYFESEPGKYRIYTPLFIAVCKYNTIKTIYPPDKE